MRFMRQALLLAGVASVFFAFPAREASAQVNGFHFTIEPWGGFVKFAKNTNLENEPLYGGTLGLNLHRYVGVEGFIARSSTETRHGSTLWSPSPLPSPAVPVPTTMLLYGGEIIVSLRPSAWLVPFLTAGWQEAKLEADLPSDPPGVYENGLMAGGGLKFRVGPRLSIRAEVRDALWKFGGAPTPPGEDQMDQLVFGGGVELALGGVTGVQDADNDGVSDKKDRCPDTPAGARVDANGCTLDGDSDGIADGLDQCPDTPSGARVDTRGCPGDADADRVWDGLDQCPDTPANAVVDDRGCPRDTDSDGVPDGIDQCADTPAGTRVDARGCTQVLDADSDGVPDEKDLCPFTPANVQVDQAGCPIELSEKETELLDKGRITERQIHFETAKWDILPESYPTLDGIGNILIQWPRLRIEIGGHADHRGSDAYNMDLSDKRANAVLDYLVTKYPQITRENYTSKGYGERQPVATNKTVEGMAMNRRVEFKVLNTEELKKERERRETLKRTGSN